MPRDDQDKFGDTPTDTAVDALPAGARELPIRDSLGGAAAEAANVRDLVLGGHSEPGSLDTLRYGTVAPVDINARIASQRASDAAAPLRDRALDLHREPDGLETLDRPPDSEAARDVDVHATIVSKRAASAAEQERDLAFEALREGTADDLRATVSRARRPSDSYPRNFDASGLPKLRSSDVEIRGASARSDDDTGVTTRVSGNAMRGTINRRAGEGAPSLDAEDHALIARLRALPQTGREPDWNVLESAIRADVRDQPMHRPWWQRWQYLVPLGALATTAAVALMITSAKAKPATDRTSLLAAPRDAGTSGQHVLDTPSSAHTPALWLDSEAFDLDDVDPAALDEAVADPAAANDAVDDDGGDTAGDDGILPVIDYGWLDTLDDAAVARAESWLARKRS